MFGRTILDGHSVTRTFSNVLGDYLYAMLAILTTLIPGGFLLGMMGMRGGMLMKVGAYIAVAWIIGFLGPLVGGFTGGFLVGLGVIGTFIGYAIQGGIIVFIVGLVLRALGQRRS